MKKWHKELHEDQGLPISDTTPKTLSLHDLSLNGEEGLNKLEHEAVTEFFQESEITIYLYHTSPYKECLIIDNLANRIFVSDFFYHTIIGSVLKEFKVYLAYIHLLWLHPSSDLHIDLHQEYPHFIQQRSKDLTEEELDTLQLGDKHSGMINQKAFLFVNQFFSNTKKKMSTLERKIIRDIIGTRYAKRLLGLNDDAYSYIEEKADPLEQNYSNEMLVFNRLEKEIEEKKIFFEEYANKVILNKNLLIWTWWTISPFVSADISILLPLLAETKTIRKVYIDLCKDSQPTLQDYIQGKGISEEQIEKEIKKIYPPILKDFQKETLPYMVLIEKLKQLGINVQCYGINGLELMEREPYINQNDELQYPIDKQWKHALFKEYQNVVTSNQDDLIIFFQFMKPMFAIPSHLSDERIEKIIHTDKFTGYGPTKPENRLSMYSRHSPKSQRSFVLPRINTSSFSSDTIVYYPYMDDRKMPKLNDDEFNKFQNYDSMIYSSYNGGGGQEKNVENPSQSFFQPAF